MFQNQDKDYYEFIILCQEQESSKFAYNKIYYVELYTDDLIHVIQSSQMTHQAPA